LPQKRLLYLKTLHILVAKKFSMSNISTQKQIRLGFPSVPRQSGFALVIALGLMAFIVLLLLSMASLLRVETKASEITLRQLEARQNAVLGLNLAIGDLQREMGPDRRVSTTAGILDTNPYNQAYDPITGVTTIDGVRQERIFWVGAWETGEDAAGYPQTTFSRWLVSGQIGGNPLNQLGDVSGGDFAGPVQLLSGGNPVEVGKVLFEGGREGGEGAYAFWVSDESVKAKVGIVAPESGLVDEAIFPHRYGLAAMENFAWLGSLSGALEQVTTHNSFKFFAESVTDAGGVAAVDQHFHNLSYASYGVLANSLEGGLRKDLTAGLFDLSSDTLSFDAPQQLIFPPAGGSAISQSDPGGPLWSQLRSWINLQPNSSGVLPVQLPSATQVGLYPVLAGVQIYFMPSYDPDSGQVRMNYFPTVRIWNPYNRIIEGNTYSIALGHYNTASGSGALSEYLLNWGIFINGGPLIGFGEGVPIRFQFTTGPIGPGESLVFSPPNQHTPFSWDANPPAELVSGYNPGFAFHSPVSGATVDTTAPDDPTFGWQARGWRTEAVQFFRGAGSDADLLQEFVYVSTVPLNRNGQGGFTSNLGLIPNPNSAVELGDRTAGGLFTAYGQKYMRVMTNNLSVWDAVDQLPPATRKWLRHFNPRAMTSGPWPMTAFTGSGGKNFLTSNPSLLGTTHLSGITIDDGFTTLDANVGIGYNEGFDSFTRRAILFQSAPSRFQLASIGQLMHAPLYNRGAVSGNLNPRVSNSRFDNLIPAYAVGNSLADPAIGLNALSRDFEGYHSEAAFNFRGIHHDYSYRLNEALWDRYFFSTLPSAITPQSDFLGNFRLVGLQSEDTVSPADLDLSATSLLIGGAFNINSTSVEAWRALLASFYDSSVFPVEGVEDSPDSANPRSPFLRVDRPVGGTTSTNPSATGEAESYIGYRSLSADQIESLAQKIVEEVKLRGPFASIAQFVNRMPNRDGTGSESTNAFRLRGAISAAIDKTTINEGLKASNLETLPSGIQDVNTEAEQGWRSEGLPAWLTQSDVFARLGSVLSSRSDTFRIRAYGETRNPLSGEVISARCEAIIQRLPQYVNANENAAETPFDPSRAAAQGLNALSAVNEAFGRQFVVVRFRWLEGDAF